MSDPNTRQLTRRLIPGISLVVSLCLTVMLARSVQADSFPDAGYDSFESTAIFNVVLTPSFGGGRYKIRVEDANTVILRSSAHGEQSYVDRYGAVVGDGSAPPPVIVDPDTVSDGQMGPKPSAFDQVGGFEVHTKIAWLQLENADGWRIRAGDAAPTAPRSLGEVESFNPWGEPDTDFPARSFFNLYLEVDLPASLGGMTLVNVVPITVELRIINGFPPLGETYIHTFETVNGRATPLYDITGCILAGWLMRVSHGVGAPNPPGDTARLPHIPLQLPYPTVFSVDGEPNPAEGLIDSCWPTPNDVFALGTAGGWGGSRPGLPPLTTTKAELFQSSGALLGAAPDVTNILRITGALGAGEPGPPPYMGPITPPPGPPGPPAVLRAPGPFDSSWSVGAMGMQEGDNLVAVSFGEDGGDLPIFSVDPAAVGLPGTAVNDEAVLSPVFGRPPAYAPSNVGGSPGAEAAGDIFIGPQTPWTVGPALGPVTAAAPVNSNVLGTDEMLLGLQAPDTIGSAHTLTHEDDLDALELSDGTYVDTTYDGIPDNFIYFSLDGASPTVGIPDPWLDTLTELDTVSWGGVAFRPGAPDPDGVTPDDILIAPPGGFMFGIYASGVQDIGLLAGDEIDAVALYDEGLSQGFLDSLTDGALFSLKAGSPSLTGANPNMPAGPLSPGDVYLTDYTGTIFLYASAASLGLTNTDELNALDIINACEDYDGDGWCDLEQEPPLHRDNCPDVFNPTQADVNWNGFGDACEGTGGINWPTLQHDYGRTGASPVYLGQPWNNLTLNWSYIHPTNQILYTSPIIFNDRVICSFDNEYKVFNLADGSELFTISGFPLGSGIRCAPTIDSIEIGGVPTPVMFIVGGDNGTVAAFNLDTDTLLWSRDINSVGPEGLFGPTHWGNFIVLDFGGYTVVYWTTDSGYVVAADAATGSLWPDYPVGVGGHPFKSGVSDGQDRIYYVTGPGYPGHPSGCYYEILAEMGDILTAECGMMDLQEEFRGGAVYVDGSIYANSCVIADTVDGFFYEIEPYYNAIPSNAQTHYGGPMVGGDGQRVFVPTTSQWADPPLGGQMVAFDITTGDVDWASSSIGGGGYNCDGVLLTDPVGIPQLLYGFSDDGILSCFDPVTGEELYRRRIDHGARSNNTGLGGAAGTTAEGEAHLVFADLYGGLYDFTIQMDRPRLEIQDYTPEETVTFGGPQPQLVVFENLLVNTGGADLVLDSLVVCSCSCDGYLPGSEPYSPIGPERKDSLRVDKTEPLDHTRGSRSDPPAWFLGLVSPNADSSVAPGDTADLVILVNPSLLAEGVVVACVQLFSSDPDFFLNDTTQAPEIEITMLCDFENCCTGFRGNVDYDPGDGIDISDLVYLVDYMFTGGSAPSCTDEADIDGSGEIDISDLVFLVDYMFNGGPEPVACP